MMISFSQIIAEFAFARQTWRSISSNWLVSIVSKATLLAIIFSMALLIWKWRQFPPQVPLWYSKPWGEDQLATPIWLFLLPGGSLIIYALNICVSVYLLTGYLVLTQILFLTSFVVSFFSFITLVQIIFLVT